MRLSTWNATRDVDDLFDRFFGETGMTPWTSGAYAVPTDVFHTQDRLVVRLDLPGVRPDDVELTVQENTLLVNGRREFPFEADSVRFVRRGSFYGDFTQRIALGKGLDLDKIHANFDNGVLEITIPYAEEIQPKKISIDVGSQAQLQS